MEYTNLNPWKRLLQLLQLEKSDISSLYFYAIVSGILSLSLPLGIQSVIQFIQSGQITTSWMVLVVLVIFGVVLTGIMQIMQLRITENIQQRIFVHYSFDFAHRFPRIDRNALKGKSASELMNRFFDIISLQKGFSKVLLDFTSSLLQILFSLIVLSLYHPFYIAFSFLLVLLLLIIFRPIMKKGLETSLNESKYKYATAFWLQEIARSNWSFRMNPSENLSLKRLDENATSYLKSRENHFQILWKQFIWMIAIKALIVASLLGLGGYLVISQQINLGQFVAAEVLILLLLGAVEKIIQSLETLYDVCTSLEKLEQVRDMPESFEEYNAEANEPLFPVELMHRNVAEETVKSILRIDQGQQTLLVGSDQRRIHQLLQQLVDPSLDESFFPRWNFQIPKESMLPNGLSKMGWFTKDAQLIAGDLIDNVQFGRATITEQKVIELIDFVGLTYLYENAKEGLNLTISKHLHVLSEEQTERILIARALAGDPQLLILSFIGSCISNDKRELLLTRISTKFPNLTLLACSETPLGTPFKIIEFNTFGI